MSVGGCLSGRAGVLAFIHPAAPHPVVVMAPPVRLLRGLGAHHVLALRDQDAAGLELATRRDSVESAVLWRALVTA